MNVLFAVYTLTAEENEEWRWQTFPSAESQSLQVELKTNRYMILELQQLVGKK